MNKLLTISIAAYNVENYIIKTLDSLCSSKYIDLIEIVIVNDGSKDRTNELCKDYAIKYPQSIIYIDKENGGHGSTINSSIKVASGKFYRVIDGDDWVDTEVFDKFLDKLMGLNTDIVLNDYVTVAPNKSILVKPFSSLESLKKYELQNIKDIGNITLHTLTVLTETIRKSNIQITENCYYVDIEYIYFAMVKSNTLTYIDLPVYCYRVGNINQSISKISLIKNIDMQVKVCKSLAQKYKSITEVEGIGVNKIRMIFNRIKRSFGSVERTYLLIGNFKQAKNNIKNFEQEIYEISNRLYDEIGGSVFFRVIRFGDYLFVPLVGAIYRAYCVIKHEAYK